MEKEKQIHLNKDLLFSKINEGDFTFCTDLLTEEFKLIHTENNSVITKYPSEDTITVLGNLLSRIVTDINDDETSKDALLLIKQFFKSLRNCLVNGEEVQNSVSSNSSIIENSYIIFENFLSKNEAEYSECLRMELQFLSNLTVSNSETQKRVWNKYNKLLKVALVRSEIANVVTMILYNIFKQHDTFIPTNVEFMSDVLAMHAKCIENIPLLLELLLNKNIITNFYNEFSTENKILILEGLHQSFIEDTCHVSYDFITLLTKEFERKSDCILKTVADYINDIEPEEVTKLLDCLASASSKENYLLRMQEDKSLLINCVFLLKMLHSLGKQGRNNFTPLQKLSDIYSVDSTGIQDHPVFGFKANLIRLIGNLCHKHKINQEQVKELEGIPLLLDCCNIDARNPLIIQWVILAIRNLCEDNKEIQGEIGKLTKVGVVDSAVVREMGLTLHDDGEDKICIAPLNLNK